MIKAVIICEYNPFHNGHSRQIGLVRGQFDEEICVISLMSGNFVQRGDIALLPKEVRAEIAIKCGSDLVLELPYPFSGASAELFATGAVRLADLLGVDYLCFGCESGDLSALTVCRDRLMSDSFALKLSALVTEKKNSSVSYLRMRDGLYRDMFGEALPQKPNDILALEYLCALQRIKSRITPIAVKREGSESATKARRAYLDGNLAALTELVPPDAYDIMIKHRPVSLNGLSDIIISALRLMPADGSRDTAELAYGLDGRLIKAARKADTLEGMLEAAATKKYTNARIRRTAISMLLSTTGEAVSKAPCYTRLLGANARGRLALAEMKFPVVSTMAHIRALCGTAKQQALFSERADSIYSLADKNERINKPYII